VTHVLVRGEAAVKRRLGVACVWVVMVLAMASIREYAELYHSE